jgi:hypothetical protein
MVVRVQYEIPPASTNTRYLEAAIDFSANGDNTLIALVAAKKIKVHRLFLVVSTATNLTFKDGATALTGAMFMSANGGFTLDMQGDPWFTTTAGAAFVLGQSGTAQISGRLYYSVAT